MIQKMIVDGHDLDLSGLEIMPGLINAHDHLHFALFPQLGSGPYANATEWAHDIYRPAGRSRSQALASAQGTPAALGWACATCWQESLR